MNIVAEMLLAEPTPALIWATLVLITFPALLILGSPTAMRHPRRALRDLVTVWRERGEHHQRQAEEAAHAERFASEVRVAADRAADTAGRWQQVWRECESGVNAAWQAWLDADARVRAGVAAAAWGTPWSVRTCEEYAARERFLHRTVAAAVERGELPAEALADALDARNGWDPRLHAVEQDLVILRASAAHLRSRYEQAQAAERAAWHDAELARRAADSLRIEAAAAVTPAAVTAPVRTRAAQRPVPAVAM